MKTIITLSILSIVFLSFGAKLTNDSFAEINSYLSKAKGKSYMDGVSGWSVKIVGQEFTESTIIVKSNIKGKHSTIKAINRYTNIKWNKLKDYYIWPVKNNDKLREFRLVFDTDVKHEYYFDDDA